MRHEHVRVEYDKSHKTDLYWYYWVRGSAVGESRVPGSRPNASSHGRKKLMLDTRKKEDVVKLCKWITNTIYITVDQSCKIVQRLTDDHKIVFYAHKHGLNLRLKPQDREQIQLAKLVEIIVDSSDTGITKHSWP